MSNALIPPVPAVKWWQRPVVAIATVVAVTGLTGGVAYAATRGDAAGAGQQQEARSPDGQLPGGRFPGGRQGQVPGQQGGTTTGTTTGTAPGQASPGSAPTT